jgi:uncharacterized protein with PQ loop repeat
MNAAFVTTMLVVANVMGAGMAYPQVARLIRTGNTEGISGIWAGVSFSMNLWWLSYGLANNLWGLVPVSAVAAVLYAVIVVVYLRLLRRRALGQLALGGLVLGMAPLPFFVVGGWELAGIAIGLCYGMQLVPALVAACRTRDLEGVAPATWIMAWIESVIWLAYGTSVADGALLVGGISGAVMASLIIVRLAATGHQPFRFKRPAFSLA